MLKINLGMIGCGSIAQFAHLPAIQKSNSCNLVALCDISEISLKALAWKYNVPFTYTDYKELLCNPEIDAVLITAPDAYHIPIAKDCLKANRHILIEKPLATTSREAEELLPLNKDNKLIIQIGNMKRTDPGIQYARDYILNDLGQVFSISGWYCDTNFRSEIQKSLLPPIEIEHKEKAYSTLKFSTQIADKENYSYLTHGIHLVNTLQFLGGKVESVVGSKTIHEGSISWHGLVQYSSGATGTLELIIKINADWDEGFKVHGENGSIYGKTHLHFYKLPTEIRITDYKKRMIKIPINVDGDLFSRQLEAFALSINEKINPICSLQDAIFDLKVLEALRKSIDSNLWEHV
jgi:predicted dehydrogenase